jgi:hypothetical protein
LKPENVLRRRSENNHRTRRRDGGNNYVRSLELKLKQNLTTGMFNLVVKDPIRTALGGRFGSNEHTTRAYSLVLETFQTYRDIRRAVNLCPSLVNRNAQGSTGFGGLFATPRTRTICRSQSQALKFSAQRHRSDRIQ